MKKFITPSLPAVCLAAAMFSIPTLAQTDSMGGDLNTSGNNNSSNGSPGNTDSYNDPVTGAKVTCISKGITDDACVIYFTQPCITPDGKYALVREQRPDSGHTAGLMYRYELATGKLVKITDRMTRNQVMFAQTGNLYYSSDGDTAYYVTNIYTSQTRKIADLPKGFECTAGVTVNADESVIVGTCEMAKDAAAEPQSSAAPNKGPGFGATFAQHNMNMLVSANIKTGEVKVLHQINTWLGHVQFSPKDADLLMYCHEGPWDQVDRIWTLRLSNPTPQLVLKRKVPLERAGHEFWSADGTTAWYDHGSKNNNPVVGHWLEGKNLSTGVVTRYPITRQFESIHYTQSPDGKFFVCDGGKRPNIADQAMYALVPDGGKLDAIKLCSMQKNNYATEPNPHLTPDQHYAIFSATFSGKSGAYMVEMPKQFWRQ
jgi:oligogalacturonide lyase